MFSTRVKVTEEDIGELVAARLARQAVLAGDDPPMLWAIITEAALRCPVGGRAVMREQVERLIELATRPPTLRASARCS